MSERFRKAKLSYSSTSGTKQYQYKHCSTPDLLVHVHVTLKFTRSTAVDLLLVRYLLLASNSYQIYYLQVRQQYRNRSTTSTVLINGQKIYSSRSTTSLKKLNLNNEKIVLLLASSNRPTISVSQKRLEYHLVPLYSRRSVGVVGLHLGPKWLSTCNVRGPPQAPLKKSIFFIYFLLNLFIATAGNE